MSKVLLINGSPNEHGCTYTALCEVAASLEKNGIETEILYLGKAPVPGCIACGRCRRDGLCSFGGQVNDIIKRIDEFDGIVAGEDAPPVALPLPLKRILSFSGFFIFCFSPAFFKEKEAGVYLSSVVQLSPCILTSSSRSCFENSSACFCSAETSTVLRMTISLRVARAAVLLASWRKSFRPLMRSMSASRRARRAVSVSPPSVVAALVRFVRRMSSSYLSQRRPYSSSSA